MSPRFVPAALSVLCAVCGATPRTSDTTALVAASPLPSTLPPEVWTKNETDGFKYAYTDYLCHVNSSYMKSACSGVHSTLDYVGMLERVLRPGVHIVFYGCVSAIPTRGHYCGRSA